MTATRPERSNRARMERSTERSDTGTEPDPTQLLHDGHLARPHTLDPVTLGLLHGTDVLDEAPDALGLDRSCLVAPPHRSVDGDVAFDHAGAEGRCRYRRRQT